MCNVLFHRCIKRFLNSFAKPICACPFCIGWRTDVEDMHWQSLVFTKDDCIKCETREAFAHYVRHSKLVVHVEYDNSTVIPPPCHIILVPPMLWAAPKYGSLITKATSAKDPNLQPFSRFCHRLLDKTWENEDAAALPPAHPVFGGA